MEVASGAGGDREIVNSFVPGCVPTCGRGVRAFELKVIA
jgi:hypothetical protein